MKGKRTYIVLASSVLLLLGSILTDFTILTPEITASIVGLLNALGIYFRSQA